MKLKCYVNARRYVFTAVIRRMLCEARCYVKPGMHVFTGVFRECYVKPDVFTVVY